MAAITAITLPSSHQHFGEVRVETLGQRVRGRAAEDTAIRIAFGQEDGNVQRAARLLGITDRALQMRRAEQRQQTNGDTPELSAE